MTNILYRYIIFIVLTIFLFPFRILSQEYDEVNLYTLSLDQAIEYSFKNSHKLKVITLEEKIEREKLKQINIDYFPDLYITSDLRRNLIIPTTPIPASMINPNADADELMYMRFNTPWNATAGLNLSFDIFNPSTFGKNIEQKHQLEISELEIAIEQKNMRSLTCRAYIDCLIAEIQNQHMIADTILYSDFYDEALHLYAKGHISLVEKNNAEINFNNSLSKVSQSEIIYREAKSNLLAVMGIGASEDNIKSISLSQNIEEIYDRFYSTFSVSDGSLLQDKQTEIVKLAQIKTNNAKLQYFPKLTLTGYYGANYFGHSLNLANSDKWFGNSFVSLTLRIPISGAISNSTNVSQLKFRELIEQENLNEINQNVSDELTREQSAVNLNMIDYKSKKKNLELHKSNVKAKTSQLEKGYILHSELMSEILLEQNAFQEYLQSAHNMLSSFISIQKLMR